MNIGEAISSLSDHYRSDSRVVAVGVGEFRNSVAICVYIAKPADAKSVLKSWHGWRVVTKTVFDTSKTSASLPDTTWD